jgi:ABC-type uncharacterized transport system permease subunit
MSMTQQTAETGATMTAKAAPPLAVVGANIAGWNVPDAVQWLTLAYVVLMVVHKLWQMGLEAYRFWVLKKRDE